MNRFIPVHMGDGVGVASSHYAIPQVGYPSCVSVVPAYTPASNRSCASVGDFYRGGKSVAPIIGDRISAFSVAGYSGGA